MYLQSNVCMHANSCSFFFSLMFTGSSAFAQQLMYHTQDEGGTAVFTCHVRDEPVPTISWHFNDVPVNVTDTVKYTLVSHTPGQNSLEIHNVQSSDVGTYTCNATNVVSSDSNSGVLTVNGEDCFIFNDVYVNFSIV